MKTSLTGPFFIMIAALLWGLDGILRRSLYDLPPVSIVFFEHLFGLALILPFVWKGVFRTKLSKRDFWLMALIALLSGLLGTLFFTSALLKTSFISFSVVFLLQKLQPIFAVLSALIFLKERPHKKYFLWAGIAFVAAYFVTFPNGMVNLSTGTGTVIAALLAVGAAFAWGSSTTFSKMALRDRSHKDMTGLRFLMTTIMAFFAVALLGKTSSLGAITGTHVLYFVAIALSTGMVGLLIYYKGLKTTPVRVSTILELTFPLVAVFIDIFLYKTTLMPSQYIAGAVLLFSMVRLAKLSSRHEV